MNDNDLERLVDLISYLKKHDDIELLLKQGQAGRIHRQGRGANKVPGAIQGRRQGNRPEEEFLGVTGRRIKEGIEARDRVAGRKPGDYAPPRDHYAIKREYFDQALQHAEEQAGRKATPEEAEKLEELFNEKTVGVDWKKREREDEARNVIPEKQGESKDYDPKGFHVGPRKGHYFTPGEREAGGKEVKVVQPSKDWGTTTRPLKKSNEAILLSLLNRLGI